jgi:hypothetical protein
MLVNHYPLLKSIRAKLLHTTPISDPPRLAAQGMDYAAQHPARTYPYQRFSHTLKNVRVLLGAAVAG